MAVKDSAELHRLARAMCSVDLAESQWTQELPRLPVPDLWLTMSRYRASLKAVLAPTKTKEELSKQLGNQLTSKQIEANWRQYEHTEQIAEQFMLNEGPELQRDLKEYANKCQNWATEFWLQDMYLSNPIPLPVNSNPFFLFPRQKFATSNEMLMFATRIIQFSVDFKFRIDQQALKQDYGSGHGKGKALCMETYKNFFHSYRMPHEDMDRLLPQSRRSNHIVVASCNQFYILRLGQDPLDNPYRKDTSSQLNESSIFEQLLRIYRVSREHARREQAAAASGNGGQQQQRHSSQHLARVGLLTSENRKEWARLHKRLSHCNANNASNQTNAASQPGAGSGASSPNTNTESLRQIEDCLFVMCLDSLVGNTNSNNNNDQQQYEYDQVKAASIILHGGGTHLFSANRWFDKFLQIIVGRNGVCGINIEHSASEGITVLRFLEEFLRFITSNPLGHLTRRLSVATEVAAEHDDDEQTGPASKFCYQQPAPAGETNQATGTHATKAEPPPANPSSSITSTSYVEPKSPSALLEESDKITPLMWHLDEDLWQAIDKAEKKMNRLVDNFFLVIKEFAHFGRGFIKSQNMSPDAFVQLGLQYTFFKLHGRLVSTYESASLRQFRLGRVDNIRANTCEAYRWIQAMLACKHKQQAQNSTKVDFTAAESSFIEAIKKQVEILRYTIVGGAPDNHLLALRELAKLRYGCAPDDAPELFRDPSYREFLNFRLSTSQLPNEAGITVGYGAVVPDGYGCSYNPREEQIIFCVSSFNDCPETSSVEFANKLEESLLEMQQLCLARASNNNK